MTKIITFFIIGVLILGPRECRGLGDPNDKEWWETALFYEVPWPLEGLDYVFNFINILIMTIDDIKKLDVDAVCLGPIFPWKNNSYTITSYKDVNPDLGTVDDIVKLIDTAHNKGIKVILDVVPFYTSDEHVWFKHWENNMEPYREFYQTETNKTKDPHRTWSSKRQIAYRHPFGNNSAILNFYMESLRRQVYEEIFTFWLDKGVDGFRIIERPVSRRALYDTELEYMRSTKKYLNEMRVHLDKWTTSHNSTSKYLAIELHAIATTWDGYEKTKNSLGVVPMNDVLLKINDATMFDKNATELKNLIVKRLHTIPLTASISWMLSHRDHSRLSSRVGDRKAGPLTMLMMLLPGHAYVLMNDEYNVGDSGIQTGTNSINDRQRYIYSFTRIAALRELPVFRQGDYQLKALNDDAVLVLRRSMPDEPVYVAVINLANRKETINLTKLYPDFEEPVDILVNTDTYHRTIGRVQSPDSVSVSPNAGIVLRLARRRRKSEDEQNDEAVGIGESERPSQPGEHGDAEIIGEMVDKKFYEEFRQNNKVPKSTTEKSTSTGTDVRGRDEENGGAVEKGKSKKTSQPGKLETTGTDKDVESPKKKGEARTEKPKIRVESDQGRGDKEDKSLEKVGEETSKGGENAATKGNKDEGGEGDERTTGLGIFKLVGKFWRSIVQPCVRYSRKKLETASSLKWYRRNRQ